MNSLADIAVRHSAEGTDPGHGDKATVHSYIPHYERLLAPYRDYCRLLEVGIACGNSIRMWAEYFGPKAEIVGVDIHVNCKIPGVTLIQADATKPEVLEMLGDLTFDVIIDDGSHMQADQEATFQLLSPRVRAGGLYIIEDILSPEASLPALTGLHPNCEVIDLRHVKSRFDDMLLVYRF